MIGRQISHYRVLAQLGAGGMGVIYEAEDTRLGRRVALKFLPERLAQDAAALERFQREARAASSLNHPNICVIYDIDAADGQPFIAMELLEGQSLDRMLHGSPLPLARVLDLGMQTADALDAAHAKGVIHRDIKPGNIFVTTRGQVKVLDFGLAKLAEDAPLNATAATSPTNLTNPGTALGTIAYMSPEQARGEELDRRTDLFSLGTVLYELATGKHPFGGATTAVIFDRIMNQAPQPAVALNAELPAEMQRIIAKSLEKDRDIRYQSAGDLRADLKRLRRETESGHTPAVAPSSSAAPAPAPASSSVLVAAAKQHKFGVGVMMLFLAATVAAALFGIYTLATRPRATPFRNVNITKATDLSTAGLVAISPDAKYLLYAVFDKRRQSLWLRHVPTNSNTQVLPPDVASINGLQFSRDGNYFYFVRSTNPQRTRRVLFRAPVLGGTPVPIVDDVDSDVTFSPDGKRVAFMRYNNPEFGKFYLITAQVTGGDERVLASGPYPGMRSPTWSPDGNTIAVQGDTPDKEITKPLVAVDVHTGAVRTVFGVPGTTIYGPVWHTDGKGVLVLFNRLDFQGLQIGYVSYPRGELHRVTNDTNAYTQLAVSEDGKTLAAVMVRNEFDIVRLPAQPTAGAEAVHITSRTGGGRVDWLDDDRVLHSLDGKVYVTPGSGGEAQPLLADEEHYMTGAMRCGAQGIVFTRSPRKEKGDATIWLADRDGKNARQLTHGSHDLDGFCTPDGRWLSYFDYAKNQIVRMPVAGGEAKVIFTGQVACSDASSDGKRVLVCYFGGQPRTRRVAVYDLESGKQLQEMEADPEGTGAGRFTPDGKALAYARWPVGEMMNLWTEPLGGGQRKPLTFFKNDPKPTNILDYAWSPNGKWLALQRARPESDVVLLREGAAR